MHEKNSRKILVDWLTFTVDIVPFCKEGEGEDEAYLSDEDFYLRVMSWLGIDPETEFIQKRGLYGYRDGWYLGGMRICFGGCMGTMMFDFSGEGCRLYETLCPEMEWLSFIRRVQEQRGYHFSRMDVACDTFGLLPMRSLLKLSLAGQYISRWKLPPRVVQGREETIDFGSPQSKIMLRIYNKTLERQCKSDVPADEIPPEWVRCEMQLRNQAVESFMREWCGSGELSTVYLGLLSSHLRFVRKRERNASRSETISWWSKLLDNAEPVKLAYRGGLEYNLDSLYKYLRLQCSSSFHTWLEVNDWDVDMLVRAFGNARLNERQMGLVRVNKAVKREKV